MADLLREGRRATASQGGVAPPQVPRPENHQGQASTMQGHGRTLPLAQSSFSSGLGRNRNLANGPQDFTDEASGVENLNNSGTRVFQVLRGKVDDEKETFDDLYKPGPRSANKQLIIKSTKERLNKLKDEYMKSHQTLHAM